MEQKIIRCAIYTRKSTEEGLDKEFNTLEAQREAGENYIKSQKDQGWILIPDHYDDGGYSGGNLKRPALKRLLEDIENGKVDMIVVYKIDRLTRSLLDFSQLIKTLEANNCSFVSVTQNFNTCDSMGKLTSNNHNAMYKTYTYSVTTGRYEVRATRLDTKDTSSRAGHEIRWGSAKGYIVSDKDYGNVSLLAITMKATDNLSQRSSRMVNCIVTRKLPIWSLTSGWSSPVVTRSIAWALADILKADYGAKLADKNIDLEALARLDQTWRERSDTFNAVFDSKLTVYEALSRCAKVGRAIPFIQGGIVRFVRDEPKTIPVALFGPRNIVKNSLTIQYIMPSEDTADSVCVQYFSDRTWKNSEVTGTFAESASDKTATVELFGCTDKD